MKTKSLKVVLVLFLALCLGMLAGCGSVSQSYADKVNEAMKNDEAYTYEKVLKDLGDPTTSAIVGGKDKATGVCIWWKGCKTTDDVKKKINDGKEVPAITITFTAGKATVAAYSDNKNPDDK